MSHHFVADRPIDAVFDVVTTARYWTEWHPAQSQAGVASLARLVGRQIPA